MVYAVCAFGIISSNFSSIFLTFVVMNWKPILIGSSVLLLAAALGVYWWQEVELMSYFDFEFQSIKINTLDGSEINADVTFKITSKTNIQFSVSNVLISLSVNNQSMGAASNTALQAIPAEGFSFITFNFDVIEPNIVQQLQAIIQGNPNTPIEIETTGTATISTGFISLSCPFSETFPTSLKCLVSGLA